MPGRSRHISALPEFRAPVRDHFPAYIKGTAMPNITSAKKRLRQNERIRSKNRSKKSRMWTLEKNFAKAVEAKDVAAATAAYSAVCSSLDKATKSHLIHANKADRKKSRLAAALNKIAG
jgi:small subunit ribosomal protein S20